MGKWKRSIEEGEKKRWLCPSVSDKRRDRIIETKNKGDHVGLAIAYWLLPTTFCIIPLLPCRESKVKSSKMISTNYCFQVKKVKLLKSFFNISLGGTCKSCATSWDRKLRLNSYLKKYKIIYIKNVCHTKLILIVWEFDSQKKKKKNVWEF